MSVRQTSMAFPEKTRMHYSAFLIYGLKTIYDELRQENIETAWKTIKAFVSMLIKKIREPIWQEIEKIEKEVEEKTEKVKGVDAFTTNKRVNDIRVSILSKHIYTIIHKIMDGIEENGLLYEKYIIEEEE